MKDYGLTVKAYGAGALLSLAGIGLVLSVVFAGPGIILLVIGAVLFLGGLVKDLVMVAAAPERKPAQREAPLEPVKAKR